jgi:teichuronic acid biosynthesis glycosyltransferase TuaH
MVENQEYFSDVKIGAHHYAELFAQNGYEVLWLSPAYSVFHYINDNDLAKKRAKLHQTKRIELSKNIYGYAPFTLIPFIKYPLFNNSFIGKKYLHSAIPNLHKSLAKIGFSEVDILWISNIKSYYIKEFISYKKLVHRLADEKLGFKNFYGTLSKFEYDLIKESDILFATAQNLVEKASKVRDDVVYLPNGVKYNDFQKDEYLYPREFGMYKGAKKILYIGAIAEWLDKELIEYTVRSLPSVHFFFIGPDHGGLRGLEDYHNIHILGRRDYNSLPSYLNYSDLAIIPFKINKLTDAINPVKLFEYLATGTPTLTTNFKEINNIKGPFTVAYNKEEFVEKAKGLVKSSKSSSLLKEYAKNNDWKDRFETIISCVNK